MHLYIERHIAEAISKDAPVKFDQLIDISESLVEDKSDDSEEQMLVEESPEVMVLDEAQMLNEEMCEMSVLGEKLYDFDVVDGVYIDILNAGNYLVEWATRSMTGFSVDAPWFELRYFDAADGGIWKAFGPDPEPGVVKGPSSVGTMPLEITEEILSEHEGKFRIALFNASNNSVTLHRTAAVKASLIIYGIPKFDGVIDKLLEDFYREKERCCVIEALPRVVGLENHEAQQYLRICCLSHFRDRFEREFDKHFQPLQFTEYPCYNWGSTYPNNSNALRVKVVRIGTLYIFSLHGQLVTAPPATMRYAGPTNSTNAYFLRSEPYSATVDSLHNTPVAQRRYFPILTRIPSGGEKIYFPFVYDTKGNSQGSFGVSTVIIDNTGIYLDFAPGRVDLAIHYGFSIGVIIPDDKDNPDVIGLFPLN